MSANSVSNSKGEAAETLVKYKFEALGCQYISAPNKTPSIDGYIKLKDPITKSYLDLAVQVKSGDKKYRRVSKDPRYINLKFETQHVRHWHHSNIPVIILWVQDPEEIHSRVLWGYAKRANIVSGKMKILTKSELNKDAISKLLSLASRHAGRPFIPQLKSRPLISLKVCDFKIIAKQFYDSWRNDITNSPALGPVDITLKGWRHITRNKLSQADIIHRLSLLPFAKEVLLNASQAKFVRKIDDPILRRELYIVNGLYKPRHQADIIVEVVVEVEKRGGKIQKAKFYSLYEKECW